jgi:hypothetical protein
MMKDYLVGEVGKCAIERAKVELATCCWVMIVEVVSETTDDRLLHVGGTGGQ